MQQIVREEQKEFSCGFPGDGRSKISSVDVAVMDIHNNFKVH